MYNDNNNERYYKALEPIIHVLFKQREQINYMQAVNLISEIKGLFTELKEEQKKQSLNLKQ